MSRIVGRLGNEIDGTDFKRLERHIGSRLGQRRNHDHGHRPQRHDLSQEGDAVHIRHLDVERHHIRIQRLDALACDQRIAGRADHLNLRIVRQ